MSTGKIELSVGAVKIANKYEIFTEEEVDAINNKIPELDERVGVIEDDIEEINSSLDSMESLKATKQEVEIERKRIDNLAKLGEGSTTGDAELIDARVDDLGVIHANLGTAIRTRISKLNRTINTISDNVVGTSINIADISLETTIADHQIKATTGELIPQQNWNASYFIDIEPNTEYSMVFYFEEQNQYIRQSNVYYSLYDTNGVYIKGGNTGNKDNPTTINSGTATKIRISCSTLRVKTGFIMLIKTTDESKVLGKDKNAYVKSGAALGGLLKDEFNRIEEEFNKTINTISDNVVGTSINIADISLETTIADHQIKATTGELISSTNWSASDYIDIEPNTEYSFVFYFEEQNQYIRQSNVYYGLYDTNEVFITGGNTGPSSNPTTINSGTATKIRMSCTTMRVKSGYIMLIKTTDESKFLGKDKSAYVKSGVVLGGLLKEEFNRIEEELKNNKGSGFTPKIILPSEFYAVVGHELSIYNENVILCDDINRYDIDWHINQGNFYDQYKECFRITPTKGKEGNYSVRLRIKDKCTRTILAEKTMTMHIVSEKNYTNKKVLFIGDSRTSAGYYPYEIQNVLSSGGITSLGTETTTPWINNVQKPINHEGRGAWSAKDYVATTSKNGYTNPFINPSTSKFDFSYYMTQQGYASVDVVFLNLGTNGMVSKTLDESIQANINAMDEMIASIRSFNSNIPIIVELVTPPATQDGWTYANHGGSVWEMMLNIFRNNEMVIEHYTNKNVYLAPTIFNLDRNNDYGIKTMSLSARNSKEVERQTNNLHPSDIGYYKMADVFWAIINAVM